MADIIIILWHGRRTRARVRARASSSAIVDVVDVNVDNVVERPVVGSATSSTSTSTSSGTRTSTSVDILWLWLLLSFDLSVHGHCGSYNRCHSTVIELCPCPRLTLGGYRKVSGIYVDVPPTYIK